MDRKKRKTQDQAIVCLEETHFSAKETDWKHEVGERHVMQRETAKQGSNTCIRQNRL